MTETQLIYKIRIFLEKEYGAVVIKYIGSPYAQAGASDLICSIPCRVMKHAHPLFIEVKLPDNHLTKLQLAFLEKVRKTGAIGLVARSVDDLKRSLDYLMLGCG